MIQGYTKALSRGCVNRALVPLWFDASLPGKAFQCATSHFTGESAQNLVDAERSNSGAREGRPNALPCSSLSYY